MVVSKYLILKHQTVQQFVTVPVHQVTLAQTARSHLAVAHLVLTVAHVLIQEALIHALASQDTVAQIVKSLRVHLRHVKIVVYALISVAHINAHALLDSQVPIAKQHHVQLIIAKIMACVS